MQDVTIYRHEDGKARVVAWSDREMPTEEEITPLGAKFILYTTMPYDWVEWIKGRTEDEVNKILAHYLP